MSLLFPKESLLDASFSKLEITHGNPHLIITEPACNPRLSRSGKTNNSNLFIFY